MTKIVLGLTLAVALTLFVFLVFFSIMGLVVTPLALFLNFLLHFTFGTALLSVTQCFVIGVVLGVVLVAVD